MPGSAMMPAAYSQRARAGAPGRRSARPSCCATAARCRASWSRASRSRTPPPWWPRPAARTNAGLHLPAIAHEAGVRFTLDDVAEVFARTPLIANLQPGGKYLALDLHRVGGVGVVLKALLDGGHLHGDCARRCRAARWPRNWRGAPAPDGDVVRTSAAAVLAQRRRGGAEGQPRTRRRADQGGGAEEPGVRRPGAGVRERGRRASPRSRRRPTRPATCW